MNSLLIGPGIHIPFLLSHFSRHLLVTLSRVFVDLAHFAERVVALLLDEALDLADDV